MGKDSIYCKYIKGAIDRIVAIIAMVCFSWLYFIIDIAIKIDDPKGPIIFKQERIGKNGKVYWIYKFRSMKVGTEHTGSGVYSDSHDTRVTRIGRTLRSSSLDGHDIIGQTTESLINKRFRSVSPIHIYDGCNRFSQNNVMLAI